MAMVRAKSNLETLTISYGKFKSKTNANLEYLISKMWQGQDKAKNNQRVYTLQPLQEF